MNDYVIIYEFCGSYIISDCCTSDINKELEKLTAQGRRVKNVYQLTNKNPECILIVIDEIDFREYSTSSPTTALKEFLRDYCYDDSFEEADAADSKIEVHKCMKIK